jgi:2-alkyl-3-oxoalkanoate reductase
MLIGVIGATGVLGRQVIPQLVENGHQVRAIVREPEAAERLRCTGVEPVIGDILAGDDLIPALASCDAALHLAARFFCLPLGAVIRKSKPI